MISAILKSEIAINACKKGENSISIKYTIKINMEIKEITINSNQDNLPISIAMIIPDTEIKGIFQISHGMAEHKERYYDFMKYLSSDGYITIINDHRGHGKSIKTNEDLGFFYDNNAEFIVEDLHQITNYIKNKYPDKKIILLGHSMGSLVVRKYIKKYDADIHKLIVCGSPSNNPFTNIAIFITNVLEKIKENKYRSKFIQNLAFGSYNKSLENAKSINSWICANEETVKEYDKDSLCGFIFTLNGFKNLFKLVKDVYSKKNWNINNKKLPIFFIAGEKDPVIINKKEWIKSQEFLKKLGYENIEGKLYPNLRHEILNEKEKSKIYEDILNFII